MRAAALEAEAKRDAVSNVHSYVRAAAARDWAAADAFWIDGKAPARPGDEVLRGIGDMRALRITNEVPTSLDQESPPRSLEIPVVLRVTDGAGRRELKGWYRVRREVHSNEWKLTSASLAPAFD